MKDKIVTIIDYVNKLLAVMLSVYFIATLIYKNQYVSISIDVLMLGIMISIYLDYLIYIFGNFKENVLINKVIRGCVWAVAICVCNRKGFLFWGVILLIFLFYISNKKRKSFDMPVTILTTCIFMEFISIIDIFFDGQYRYPSKAFNNSLGVDIVFVIGIVLYIYSDKVTDLLMKLPSIEKSNEDDLDNTDNEVGEKTQTIYMGMVFLGALLGLHLYSSLCIDKGYLHILMSSIIIIFQIIILYELFGKLFEKLDNSNILMISIATVCLPYINYRNYSLKAALIYLISFSILFCIFKMFKSNKMKWIAVIIITIAGTISLFLNGNYTIPIINVIFGMILGKAIQKNKKFAICICIFMIICSQCIIGEIFIKPIKSYNDSISQCTNINEKIGKNIHNNLLNDNEIIYF